MYQVWGALLLALVTSAVGGVETFRVVTTLPYLTDWVREIGGERVEVRTLIQSAGDPVTYEPTVDDVKAIAGSRVLVTVGLGFEPWVSAMVERARNSELSWVVASDGTEILTHGVLHESGAQTFPPGAGRSYVWFDPAAAVIMCRNITAALESADPFAGDYYQKRLNDYEKRLEAAVQRLRKEVQGLADKRFVASHAGWSHLARGLGIELVDVFTEVGGQEPSDEAVARLAGRVREQKIRVLVTEPSYPSGTPKRVAGESQARWVRLSPFSAPGEDYLDLLRSATENLRSALQESRP